MVYEGVINVLMGVFYGVSGGYIIIGNLDNCIYGGNFLGIFWIGVNGFLGGIINVGLFFGNVKFLIDLRNYNGEFKLFGNIYIIGGWFYG